ncbi:acetyltransferase [Stanieria sp. NIES-3757]|nr:acetyltransferase [Stanieria sp. NIES-3757]
MPLILTNKPPIKSKLIIKIKLKLKIIYLELYQKMMQFLGEALLYFTNHVLSHIPFHFIRLFYYRVFLKFKIEKNSLIFMNAWFDTKGNFKIGKNSVINQKCRQDNRGGISIGDNVSISAEVCILTGDHDLKCDNFSGRTRPVKIEDYVFIGTRAMILPEVTLGKGSAVAAGALVTKDVSLFTIVAGVSAKSIGNRPTSLDYSCYYPRLFF